MFITFVGASLTTDAFREDRFPSPLKPTSQPGAAVATICDLGPAHLLEEKAKKGFYNYIVSGMDWGGTDYLPDLSLKKSTTVHIVVGVRTLVMTHPLMILCWSVSVGVAVGGGRTLASHRSFARLWSSIYAN